MIDLGDTAGEDMARELRDAMSRAVSAHRVRKTTVTNNHEGELVPRYIAEPARDAAFAPGAPGNRRFDVAATADDPHARILADRLDADGIPYAATSQRGIVTFELSRAGRYYAESCAARLVALGRAPAERFPGCDLSRIRDEWVTFDVRTEREYTALWAALESVGARFEGEWDARGKVGTFAMSAAQHARLLEDFDSVLGPEIIAAVSKLSARERAGIAPDARAKILFKTRPDDPGAQIMRNGLARAGVESFTVATPDPEGQVIISVASQDAPALVQVAESYIDNGTIERGRFEGLEDLKQRAAVARRAQERARAGHPNAARARAEELARSRGQAAPERTRTAVR